MLQLLKLSILLFLNISLFINAKKNPSIIIIGGGPAGIATFSKLFEYGFNDIKILEAENRYGGRINSVKLGDGFTDLGAEYCHGKDGNIVYKLVKDYKILQATPLDTLMNFYSSDGTRVDSSWAKELFMFMISFEDIGLESNEDETISLGEAFLNRFKSTILKKYESEPDKLQFFKDSIMYAESMSGTQEGSFSWLDPSFETHYDRCPGNQLYTWGGLGYKTILEVLLKSYPDPSEKVPIDTKLFFSKVVTKISWNEPPGIKIDCTDGTTYEADHVVFTPSLGVLKANEEHLFSPPLPITKKEAIRKLGFDGVMKVLLHFPTRFWDDHEKMFSFIWKEADLERLKNDNSTLPHSNEGIPWYTQIPTATPQRNNPNVLIMWVTGEVVPQVEHLPEDEFQKNLIDLLEKFLGHDHNITAPDRVIRSSWVSNPHFRGTYSYEVAKYYNKSISYHKILQEPLKNQNGELVLQFAGEATNPTHFSTVHGAIESGFREADRLNTLYNIDE